jgi:tRNA(Ile2) C34 agmatinyltransferase TiaS
MGLFSNPKCPKCGGKTVRTGYSFPFPQLRCNRCVNYNSRIKKQEQENQALKLRLERLEEILKNQ